MTAVRVRLAIVGCGDVVARRYLPGLVHIRDRVQVVACCDRDRARAAGAARAVAAWSPDARVYRDLDELLRDGSDAEAILNLTPAALHAEVSLAALQAGLHVYSEKPLASSLEDADRLIDTARATDRLLLCAPAVMASPRFRWLRELLDSGRLGEPTLACGQIANLGPAAWAAYASDPVPYYQLGMGPLVDEGIYLLHAVTGLLGPAIRMQAMGGVAMIERRAACGPDPGRRFDVGTEDQVLLQLQVDYNRFAQVLSSFAVPATKAPTLELHCTAGSVSLSGHLSAAGPVDVFIADQEGQGVQGWIDSIAVTPEPPAVDDLVATGALHFVACLRGEATPVLTAEHARHALEIALVVDRAINTGESLELTTSFAAPDAGAQSSAAVTAS